MLHHDMGQVWWGMAGCFFDMIWGGMVVQKTSLLISLYFRLENRWTAMLSIVQRQIWCALVFFIGPRCPWGPIYGSWCPSVRPSVRPSVQDYFADLTDVTLDDEDINSIPTNDTNRQSQPMWQCNWRHLVTKIETNAGGTTWRPNLWLIQEATTVGQIYN